ncbi:MAG: hypothetical protein Q7T05_02855 [Dehalococcoidia bacterium]|nr:hypothetical protein [Dehalococcoidia bacterium]
MKRRNTGVISPVIGFPCDGLGVRQRWVRSPASPPHITRALNPPYAFDKLWVRMTGLEA